VKWPNKPAVIVVNPDGSHTSVTFRELAEEVDRYACGLNVLGIRRGTRTILMVRPGIDFFALTFALFKIGAVTVLIDPGMGRAQLIRSLAHVEAEAFIGIPQAHVARIAHFQAFRSVEHLVTVGKRWFWGGKTLRQVRSDTWQAFTPAATAADDLAAILFTSGSTGPARGAEYTHGMFAAQVNYLQSQYGFGPDEVDLATFPLFALFDAALGMTAVIPDMDTSRPADADPKKIIAALLAHGCTHMFGSPALLDKLSRYAVRRGMRFDKLKRVMTAGAPVSAVILRRMRFIVPEDADIHTPYGATEALPVSSIECREILNDTAERTAQGAGICVGKPLPGVRVAILQHDEEPVGDWTRVRLAPVGEIGDICVQGPAVSPAYFRDDTANDLTKIADMDRFWHRMGDVGYLDHYGRLWYCGRKTHVVTSGRGRLYSTCCEGIFDQQPGVRRTALVGVGPRNGQTPVLCVEPEVGDESVPAAQLIDNLRRAARAHEMTWHIHRFLMHPGFPVDVRHNAKIFREKLAAWAEQQK
jgi:acyl-CoA synthetase (AMP-forming)/AMP-acid ligase II